MTKADSKKSEGQVKKEGDTKKRVNIGVTVDESLWRKLRALAIVENKMTGELLDAAIADYLNKQK